MTFKEWLASSSWGKRAIGRELGVSLQTILNWERDISTPRDPLIREQIRQLSNGAVDENSWVDSRLSRRGGSGAR